jgi:hypothetical protein
MARDDRCDDTPRFRFVAGSRFTVNHVEIDVRGLLLPRHQQVLGALHRLSIGVDIRRWVLVGGLMVALLGAERGRVAARSSRTKDGDVVVDDASDVWEGFERSEVLQAQAALSYVLR